MKWLFMIIGLVVCGGGIYIFLLKCYFYNEYNIYERRQVLDRLNKMYGQQFELVSTEFKTEEVEAGKYIHLWIFTLRDDQEREFFAYDRTFGSSEREGAFYHQDYYSDDYIDDTYGQLCLEERLGDKYDLYKYRQGKGDIFPYQDDYIFVCTKDKEKEIAEILTEIYFAEAEFSNGGCLRCLVISDEGEELFSYHWWTVTRKLGNQSAEITKQAVYEFVLQELLQS